jgi:hypothetical protein
MGQTASEHQRDQPVSGSEKTGDSEEHLLDSDPASEHDLDISADADLPSLTKSTIEEDSNTLDSSPSQRLGRTNTEEVATPSALSHSDITPIEVLADPSNTSIGAPKVDTESEISDPTTRDSKPPEIKTLKDLFEIAYSQGGTKRLVVKEPNFKALTDSINAEVSHPDPMRELVANLSKSDPTMAVPFRILIAFDQGSTNYRLTTRVLEYIAIAFRNHDAFRPTKVLDLLDHKSEDLDAALVAIREKIRHLPETMFENKGLKGDAREKLRLNAIDSLQLWFVMSTGTPDADYVDLLNRHVWQERLRETPIKRPKGVLAETKTPELLGWLTREFRRQMDETTRLTEEAERSSARSRAKVEELDKTLSEKQAEIEQLTAVISQHEATLASLNIDLAEQQRLRSIDKTHHVDDYKGLRTRVQRSLDKQSELLRSALHALRNERYMVADEYVERSLDAIDNERERLKAQGD